MAVSLAAHAMLIAALLILVWQPLSIIKPGSAIFVNDVVTGEGGEGKEERGGLGSRARLETRSESESHSESRATTDAGTGGERENGDGMGSGPGTGASGNPVLAEIRRRIEQSKRYPMQARAQHVEGKVGVQFLIQPNGQVSNVRVTLPSGAPVLDEAAIQAVQHSAPLPYYEYPIDLSLAFRLR